ncbi:unnamed protein product [Brassica oleracea]
MEQTKKLKTSSEFSLSDESSFFFLYQLFSCFQLLFFFFRHEKMVEVKKESVFYRNIQTVV